MRVRGVLRLAALVMFGASGVSTSSAASISVGQTVDLSTCTASWATCVDSDTRMRRFYVLPDPVQISVGDTVSIDIEFAHGQRLVLEDNGGFDFFTAWLKQDLVLSPPNTSSYTVAVTSYVLKDLDGTLSVPFALEDHSSSAVQIGPGYMDVMQSGDKVSFSGYRATFDVVELMNGSSYYDSIWVEFFADRVSVSAVPENGTLALMLVGFSILAYRLRLSH